jgi:hypothetical protein
MKIFRNLTAEETQLRIASVNNGGVELLLWKAPLADLTVLDEKEGLHYSVEYSPISSRFEGEKCYVTCSLTLDTNGNLRKVEGIGEGANFKTASTDALHRAGVVAGIGRELYSLNKVFIPKEYLKGYEVIDEKKVCYDTFKVFYLGYDEEDNIKEIVIEIAKFSEPHCIIEYDVVNKGTARIKAVHVGKKEEIPNEAPVNETPKVEPAETSVPKEESAETIPEAAPFSEGFADDEVILFGFLKGKKYREIKDSLDFRKFVDWAKKNPTRQYSDTKIAAQFKKLLNM